MATGLMVVTTGSYNVEDTRGGFLVDGVPGLVAGPNFVQQAIDQVLPGWGSIFVAIAILLFAFTLQIFFYYVASTNLIFLMGERVADAKAKIYEALIKVGALAISFGGSVVSADAMWAVGDIGYGIVAWINLVCVLLLTPIVRTIVGDYERQRRLSFDPTCNPTALGIQGAYWWEYDSAESSSELPSELARATA